MLYEYGRYSVSKVSEESRQQSSELSEQLKLRVNENNGLKQEVDELRKQLEMADSMLQQVRRRFKHLLCTHDRIPVM